MPLLYWPLTFALFFKFFKLLHEWYHYWGVGGNHETGAPGKNPAFRVDVITTACPGEPKEMIKATLLAIKNIQYPHETYLGDEGNDPELKAFCLANGIHHVSRNNRENAKAGNVNNILSRAEGDICLILDPDHQPHPLILDRILPYFEEEAIGFVQSVQAYKNQKSSLIAYGAAEQTYHFYGPLMMGMSNYGTAQAIGANCVFRRKALDSIGGHAPGLAEDMHTSMLLHARGWKSVYVPEILSRGLVPTTLSAYYKQQLKWSRGTLELLFFVLPGLWSSLSWRQRFHYASLPFYYLSAFIMLIDLVVPVVSLLISRTPWLVSLEIFLLFITPLICLTVLIRQYAQRWLLDYQERGFVLIGGLLKLGTWWVYLLGFFTTLLRIKIPYIPTPKEDEPENEKGLNFPNLLVTGICLFAIGYGLLRDFSPFSLVMASFALVNAVILLFNILISQQKTISRLLAYFRKKEKVYQRTRRLRITWWKLRHGVYGLMRTRVLFLLLFVLAFTVLYRDWVDRTSLQALYFRANKTAEQVQYKGLYVPAIQEKGGFDKFVNVLDAAHFEPAIISVAVHWFEQMPFAKESFQQVKQESKFHLISWEPWQPFLKAEQDSSSFLDEIVQGKFDTYLRQTARQLVAFDQPVFIRLAPAFGKQDYPWSAEILSNPEQFKNAWRYVVNTFRQEGAFNAIWVFNPWQPQAFESYYPGHQYVDWLGITAGNCTEQNGTTSMLCLKEAYVASKRVITSSPVLKEKPLMLTEFGSFGGEKEHVSWMQEAEAYFKGEELVKAVVYDNTDSDINFPAGLTGVSPAAVNAQFPPAEKSSGSGKQFVQVKEELSDGVRGLPELSLAGRKLEGLQGVVYQPVSYWNQGYLPLMKPQLEKDFSLMKSLQINTVYRPVSDIYDRNVYRLAKKYDLQLIQELQDGSLVSDFRQYEQLVAWSVGRLATENTDFWSPEKHQAFVQEVSRLSRLAGSLKKLDERPVIVSVSFTTLQRAAPYLFAQLRDVDAIGVRLDPAQDVQELEQLWQRYAPNQGYFIQMEASPTARLPQEGACVSDKEMADFKLLLQQKQKEAQEGYLGFVKGNWMDKNLGIPQGGIVNFRGELKTCYVDALPQQTEIYLYSNDPALALKGGKEYSLYAVSTNLEPSDSFHFEWFIFNEETGREEPYRSEGVQQQAFFAPRAGNTYYVVLATYQDKQLLYNTYLKLKAMGPSV